MDDQSLFGELLRAARSLGLGVRVERFETPAAGGGSSCVLRGERLVIIDERAPLRDRVTALARARSKEEIDAVFMVPEARQAVEALTGRGARSGRPRE